MLKPPILLVVDDDADFCDLVVVIFETKGYEVLKASNGRNAFDLIQKKAIDVVLTDLHMPGGGGLELLDNIKGTQLMLPVILFISGFGDISVEEAYDRGAEAVFSKPFDLSALHGTVVRILAQLTAPELRLTTRRDVVDLSFEIRFSAFQSSQKAKLSNIGRGGFFVQLGDQLPQKGEEVWFRIALNDDLESPEPIEGRGQVKWVRSGSREVPGCGVEFQEFMRNGREQIFQYINFLKTRQYIPKN